MSRTLKLEHGHGAALDPSCNLRVLSQGVGNAVEHRAPRRCLGDQFHFVSAACIRESVGVSVQEASKSMRVSSEVSKYDPHLPSAEVIHHDSHRLLRPNNVTASFSSVTVLPCLFNCGVSGFSVSFGGSPSRSSDQMHTAAYDGVSPAQPTVGGENSRRGAYHHTCTCGILFPIKLAAGALRAAH